LGLLADAVTPKRDFPLPTAHTPSPEVASTAPLLTQLIGDTTSAIHPNAQCKQSSPCHQSHA
jgi:hypothetical protein